MPSWRERPVSRGAFFLLRFACAILIAGAAVARSAPVAAPAAAAYDTVVVRGARLADPLAPAAAATVTLVEIDPDKAAPELADLLEEVAGMQVRRYGGLGAPVLPSVRGSSAGQVAVLIDGLPLDDAEDGVIDLAALSLDRYERVEIYRGHVPARFGGAGGAGAINLVTRRGRQASHSEWLLWGGAYGEAGLRAESGRDGVDVVLHGRRADNRFGFRNHNQTFAEPADDYDDVRRNAWLREAGLLITGDAQAGAWRSRLVAGVSRRDAGRPGPVGGYESPHADLRRDRSDVRLTVAGPHDALTLDLDVQRIDERMRDEDSEVGWDPPGVTESRSEQYGARLALRGGTDPERDLALDGRIGAEQRRQRYDWSHADLVDPRRTRDVSGAFAAMTVSASRLGLSLSPAMRWRRHEDDFPPLPAWPGLPETPLEEPHVHEHVSPQVELAWEARPGTLRWEIHWARSHRAPTWVELFGQTGGVRGNRELVPERILSRDLTVNWSPAAAVRMRMAVFASDIDDAIVWTPNSQYTSQAHNTGGMRTRGVEFEGLLDAGYGGRGWANLTVQDTQDRGDDPIYQGNDLPYLPDLEAALGWEIDRGDWTAGLRLRHASASYRDRYNTDMDRVPARTRMDLSLARAWPALRPLGDDHTELTCELFNLFDEEAYDVEGYPLPGRTFRVSLLIR